MPNGEGASLQFSMESLFLLLSNSTFVRRHSLELYYLSLQARLPWVSGFVLLLRSGLRPLLFLITGLPSLSNSLGKCSLYWTLRSQSSSFVNGLRIQAFNSCKNSLAFSRPRKSASRFSACPSLAFMSTDRRIDSIYVSKNSALLLVVAASAGVSEGSLSRKLNTRNSRLIHVRARDWRSVELRTISGSQFLYCDTRLLPTCNEYSLSR